MKKLIIEVEDDYYEQIKYNVEHGQKYLPWDIIANGIPYKTAVDCKHCDGYEAGYSAGLKDAERGKYE